MEQQDLFEGKVYGEVDGLLKGGMVNMPDHYQLRPNLEVKDVICMLLDKVEGSDFYMSLNEAGWYQQAMQYFMRFYAKGGKEDLEKGVFLMNLIIKSMSEADQE